MLCVLCVWGGHQPIEKGRWNTLLYGVKGAGHRAISFIKVLGVGEMVEGDIFY